MSRAPHVNELIAVRLSRRGLLGGLTAMPLLATLPACAGYPAGVETRPAGPGFRTATFASIPADQSDTVSVPRGYGFAPLIAWGDALFETVSDPVDLDALDRTGQEQRFGTHNDMLALFPETWALPLVPGGPRQILCANHEYFEPALAYPSARSLAEFTGGRMSALLAGLGVSVVALQQDAQGGWSIVRDAAPGAGVNRRITPFTPVAFTGPAANHPWIVAAAEAFNRAEPDVPDGSVACGTLANCAGGQTPWGTFLTSEENFQSYFRVASDPTPALEEARNDARLVGDAATFGYRLGDSRPGLPRPAPYDLAANPTGPALYGWVVEIDPYDPTSTPRKLTSIGRKKGENAATALARDGRVAVYQGDDQLNEFTYKFISHGRFDPHDRQANMTLLDSGALHVARLEADGSGRWIPITLAAANAAVAGTDTPPFLDEGDLMIRARVAARALGGTPMDRPEDVEAPVDRNWVGLGAVYIPCTKGVTSQPPAPGRPARPGETDAGGGQKNVPGHILRIHEAEDDCGADRFVWDVFLMGGDPEATTPMGRTPDGVSFAQGVTVDGRATFTGAALAAPDNLCFDTGGNAWITTDGMSGVFDCNDVVLVAGTDPGRTPEVKRFLVGPVGCEITGPVFTPDETTFFVAIQHPGSFDVQREAYAERRWATPGDRPPSSFPDGGDAWPRSCVIAVRRLDGGRVGD